MRPPFALQVTPVLPQVAKQVATLHPTTTLCRVALGHAAKTVLASILKNQSNGSSQTLHGCRFRPALTVCSRNLRRISDVPPPIPLHNCGELVPHRPSCLGDRTLHGTASHCSA